LAISPQIGQGGELGQVAAGALTLRDQINVQLEKVGGFASLRRDEDMRVSANQGFFNARKTLGVKWAESSSWFQPELLKIPEGQLRDWLKQPELNVYQHFFDDLLRTKAHVLSSREEELLAMSSKATDAATEAFGLLSNTELRWRSVKDPEGNDLEVTSSSYTSASNRRTASFAARPSKL